MLYHGATGPRGHWFCVLCASPCRLGVGGVDEGAEGAAAVGQEVVDMEAPEGAQHHHLTGGRAPENEF